jgi:hypothetical protein
MSQPTPTVTTTAARDRRIAPALLIGGTFLLTTVANFWFNAASAIWDPEDSFGAGGLSRADQLPVIAGLGILGLAAALVLGKVFKGGKGAVVLGILSLVTLPAFFSGAPAAFGSVAAVRAGFAKGGRPATGAARGFGIAGIVVVALVIVAVFGGNIAGIVENA